jgi:hypothetical protein
MVIQITRWLLFIFCVCAPTVAFHSVLELIYWHQYILFSQIIKLGLLLGRKGLFVVMLNLNH